MIVREHVPLAPLTTFRIGGPADLYIEAESESDLRLALEEARRRDIPLVPLGGGSNVLVPDTGIRGAVVRFVSDEISFQIEGEQASVTAMAGASWDALVEQAVARELWGIENLSGIPGTVGGAVVQNVGAYGAVLSNALVSARAFDTHTGTVRTFANGECAFGYRTSAFKREPGRFVILDATVALSRAPRPNLGYRDLETGFAGIKNPSASDIRSAVLAIRSEKFPDLTRYGTAGSFFLNPVVSADEARAVAQRFPGMPLFPLPEGGVKIPIAWVLDYRHGVMDLRELKVGGAFLWPRQLLVLTAEPGTAFSEVDALGEEVTRRVHKATDILLLREVITLRASRRPGVLRSISG